MCVTRCVSLLGVTAGDRLARHDSIARRVHDSMFCSHLGEVSERQDRCTQRFEALRGSRDTSRVLRRRVKMIGEGLFFGWFGCE